MRTHFFGAVAMATLLASASAISITNTVAGFGLGVTKGTDKMGDLEKPAVSGLRR